MTLTLAAAARSTFTSYWWWNVYRAGGEALAHVEQLPSDNGPLSQRLRGLFYFEACTTQICVTVTGTDAEAMRRARIAAETDADLVELRLDFLSRPDVDAVLAGRRKPVVVTCRPVREGGRFDGDEQDRLRILARAHELGAEYIDVEWDAQCDDLIRARNGRGIVVSRHDFSGTPSNTAELLGELRAKGGEIAKLSVMTGRLSDLSTLLALPQDDRSIVIGMGRAGMPTRILAGRFGSRWTYAGNAVAPGQLTARRLLQEFRFRRIRPDAAIYALLGRPVVHSLSPAMHNAGFEALGLNAVYVTMEADDVDDFRAFAESIDLQGASVTIPFKLDVVRLARRDVAHGVGRRRDQYHRDAQWAMDRQQHRRGGFSRAA